MKSVLTKFLIGVAVVIIGFLVVVALQPADYRVARSTIIATSPAVVFPHVNELQKWVAWNPWKKIDPDMKLKHEGPASGVGASFAWVGNNDVGEGRMTIAESRANELVRLKLEFVKPMTGVSASEFRFRPLGNQTEVTWSMTGKNDFIAKAMFMNMDRMIGGKFEKGLAKLKSVVEAGGRK